MTYPCGHPKTLGNTVMVRDTWEYCRICNRQRANARYRKHHPGARQKAFLSLDEKISCFLRKTPHHWIWQGQMRDGSIAVCCHEHDVYFIAKLLWERERKREVPEDHCLYRTCQVARCVRPGCRSLELRGAHITDAIRGVRGKRHKGPKRPYGMSPELAALIGLIDDEQYLACFKKRRGSRVIVGVGR